MSPFRSRLYLGRVGHVRRTPRRHTLAYRSFMLLLDLDELETLDRRLRWFSRDRFNLYGFRPRDHGDGSSVPLREQVEAHVRAAGVAQALGTVQLLCLPRMLGYVFNPISLYFCHDPIGELVAILYEVNSTFGERHTYLAPVQGPERPIRQQVDKRLHVSPFMDMDLTYAFTVQPPEDTVRVVVQAGRAGEPILDASFTGRRRDLSDATLLRTFAAYPLQTLAVMAAIHWEALRLFAKGLRLRAGPPAPADPVSRGRPSQASRR